LTRRSTLAIGSVALALAAGGVGAAAAFGGGDDGDEQATGPGADHARQAALEVLPGGHANSVERDSEDGATWEVEVTRADGRTVDVRLDENYRVVVVEGDGEEGNDSP
jgi:Peptidase propeptide and YPEB domain